MPSAFLPSLVHSPGEAPRSMTLAVSLAVLLAPLAGCASGPAPPSGPDTPPKDASPSAQVPIEDVPAANGSRLMELVRAQVFVDGDPSEVRYRFPGSQGHEEAVGILAGMLRQANLTVERERWSQELIQLGTVNLTNLYGVRKGADPDAGTIWIAAHWDSRAWADAHREQCTGPPVQGANDGAAAVASVVHAAASLPQLNHTLRVALFDAEDQGCGQQGWVQGSEHAAKLREANGTLGGIRALVLVDMPGAEDLMIRREGHSADRAPRLTNLAFSVADRLGAEAFRNTSGPPILDDHVPFLERGVPAVDLIHLDQDARRGPFPWTHHTLNDTVENLEASSIAQVTRVLMGTVLAIDRGALDPPQARNETR